MKEIDTNELEKITRYLLKHSDLANKDAKEHIENVRLFARSAVKLDISKEERSEIVSKLQQAMWEHESFIDLIGNHIRWIRGR